LIRNNYKSKLRYSFDLSRSIDLHVKSAEKTNQIAISGITEGSINLGETTRWKAKHLGVWIELGIKITKMNFPFILTDEMIDGNFKFMKHNHIFTSIAESKTLMIDKF